MKPLLTGRTGCALTALAVATLCGLPAGAQAPATADPPALAPADAPSPASAPTRDAWVRAALIHNPDLRAIAARRDAALAAATVAGATWSQPRLSLQGWLLAVETRQGPQHLVASIQQAIPSFRRLEEADDPHLADAVSWEHRFDAEVLDTVYEVETAWWTLARLDALIDLVEAQREVIRDVADHEAAVLAHGGAEHVDLLRTSLLDVVLEDRAARLGDARDETLARLAATTQMPVDELERARPALPDVLDACADVDALTSRATSTHPAPLAHLAQADRALEQAEAARWSTREPVQASMSWGTIGRYETPLPGTGRGGRDTLMVGVSVPLPVIRQAAGAAEQASLATATGAAHDAAAVRLGIEADVRGACERIDASIDRIARYERDLLPMSEDIVAHYAIDLSVDGAEHTAWLLAVENTLALREAVIEARADAALADALLRARQARDGLALPLAPDATSWSTTEAP